MSDFSAQQTYSITSSDTITIDTSTWANISAASGLDTITISNGGFSVGAAGSAYTTTYSSGAGATVGGVTGIGAISGAVGNISNISISGSDSFNWASPVEFVNCLPDFDRIQKMCKEYPGLKIAYEKFVNTYKLVKDHYDTPEDERPRT